MIRTAQRILQSDSRIQLVSEERRAKKLEENSDLTSSQGVQEKSGERSKKNIRKCARLDSDEGVAHLKHRVRACQTTILRWLRQGSNIKMLEHRILSFILANLNMVASWISMYALFRSCIGGRKYGYEC